MGIARDKDVVVAAKMLRAALAESFPRARFSVRVDRFSLGEAIDISWLDGPAETLVQQVTRAYEDISRDDATGEILGGGNRYISPQRDYSPAAWAWGKANARTETGEIEIDAYRIMARTSFGDGPGEVTLHG